MSMTEKEALQAVRDKEGEFGPLYARMKVDADLAKRKPFILVDDKGKKIPNCDHVTLPKAAIFCNRANAITAAGNQQIIVEGGDIKDDVTSKIETFYRNCFANADELLTLRNENPAFTFHSHMINERGRIGQRIILEIDEEGKFKVEIIPWDVLFVTYEYDKDGLAWASRITIQSKSSINSTYEKANITAKVGKLRDFWSREANYVYADDKLILSEANDLGEVPVAIAYSSAGLMYQDDDMEVNRGESILWLNRDLFKEANKIVSTVSTLNSGSLFPPLQKEYEEIPNEQPPSPQGGTRTVVPVRKGELYHPMPREDVYQATRMAWSIIDSHIQQGSFSTIEFGTLQFPLSAVALENLAEGRELVLAPGIQALSQMYLKSCNLIKRQFIKLGKTVELKGDSYSPSDIEGDYNLSFKYFTGSRKHMLAGITESNDIGKLVSDDFKRRELIMLENPDEEAKKIDAEQAELMHPELRVYNQTLGFMEEGRWSEAWMTRLKLRKMLMAEYSPQEPEQPRQAQPQGGQIPLFSGASGKVNAREQSGISSNQERQNAEELVVE